ncbi:MAG: DUF1636 domain-containing protein [Aphanocapsa sp. GSE-SYN-MK-11-07L]|jgi:predicted metal-binding protein|nr:DUF1636 domain-containing protein [Aphanocapsa sp. GSE-SYN-MK-11-07L]
MTQHTLFVCILCCSSEIDQQQTTSNAGQVLFEHLSQSFASSDSCEAIRLHPVRCLGACSHACVVAFAAPNKLVFILSKLSATHSVPDLLQFSGQYVACSGGKVPFQERPDAIKKGIHAVLPPLPIEPKRWALQCEHLSP